MKANRVVSRLAEQIKSDTLHVDEPLFVLRAQDELAAGIIREWANRAEQAGTPDAKVAEAREIADQMDKWYVKQTPGRPETRRCLP